MRHVAPALLLIGATLMPGAAIAGDDDKPPAYRIYIDPETGKYTTEDPLADLEQGPVARPVATKSSVPEEQPAAAMLTAAVMIAVLGGTFLLIRRQPTIRERGQP